MLETLIGGLELGFFEVTEAFKGLADENVWKRPSIGLLSVGELAGHIAYWEAVRLGCEATEQDLRPDLTKCNITSLLVDHRFRYYPDTLNTTPSTLQLSMTSAAVCQELLRIHQESVALLRALNPDLTSPVPWWQPGSNYAEYLRYATFHVAYHTGQMYSVRHLLGETTPDN